MKHLWRNWYVWLAIFYVLFVYRAWFLWMPLSAGDWNYKFSQTVSDFSLLPALWNTNLLGGLGGNVGFLLGLESWYLGLAKLLQTIGMNWIAYERLVWFWPFIVISWVGSFRLGKKMFGRSSWASLSGIIFTTNTYVLMVSGGGQMGVALAIALAPWVTGTVFDLFIPSLNAVVVMGIVLAIQLLFDARMALVTCIAVLTLVLVMGQSFKQIVYVIWRLFLAGVISVGLLSWWLIPLVFSPHETLKFLHLSDGGLGAVKFFSFAPFEHTLSFIHPNWPENIFGKISFLQPEFLVLPIIFFGGLLWIKKSIQTDRAILGWMMVGALGIFFAKGVNAPGGELYGFLYLYLPGFNLFRDPSKFYLLIALAYAVVIPWVCLRFCQSTWNNKYLTVKTIPLIVFISFLLLWSGMIRPVLFNGLGGTFRPHLVGSEYIKLKDMLDSDTSFGRTFWVPSISRTSFSSALHPAISAADQLQASPSGVLTWLATASAKEHLAAWAVSYVIVPADPEGEKFVTNRKYDPKKHADTVTSLTDIPWLKKQAQYGDLVIFSLPNSSGHFWFETASEDLQTAQVDSSSLTSYKIATIHQDKSQLFFSERFDPGWVVLAGPDVIHSQKTAMGINQFILPNKLPAIITVEYLPQRLVYVGEIISGIVMLGLACYGINHIMKKHP